MLFKLPLFLRLPMAALAILLNTVAHTTPLFVVALLKWLVPVRGFRRFCDRILIGLAESWIARNGQLIALFTPTRIEVEGVDGLRRDGHYLVLANHQSWVDIPVLQHTFNRRIPFLRFFLKSQLIWVPLLGLAWWALDFPFMKRYTKSELARKPELAGKDMEATRKACEKFRGLPVSIMNFVEGTRFTKEKHARQSSPFAHLLKPKAGGVAFVIGAMGDSLQGIVDVAIAYPQGKPTMMDLMAGRIGCVRVSVRSREIPPEFIDGDYENDRAYRVRFQQWMNLLWQEKDAELRRLVTPAGAKG
ncbi:acyltransferase [Arenimonas sp.]|uniref:acyltransferase n=1 Tax=Arenimonas sp. TaxID=1872635 RepID=UPI0039E2DB64